jgi:hypothetical protein
MHMVFTSRRWFDKQELARQTFLIRVSLLFKLMSQKFLQSHLQETFRKFYCRTNDIVCQLILYWYTDLDYGSYLLWSGNRAHGECDWSTGNVYSSLVPDPTFGISRDPRLFHSLICFSHRTYEVDDCCLIQMVSAFYLCGILNKKRVATEISVHVHLNTYTRSRHVRLLAINWT